MGDLKLDNAKRHLMEHLMRQVPDERVVRAIESIPREEFVPDDSRHMAYEDIPLEIGEGQTISQPYIVAVMLRALGIRSTDKVLDVGTGSGYQAAVLSKLAGQVISVECRLSLANQARERLSRLRYANVEVVLSGDTLGWDCEAPYDAIVVAAGAPKLPSGLIDQMGSTGRLVVPVGTRSKQELVKVCRSGGEYSVEVLGACRFVPLVGEGAWLEE